MNICRAPHLEMSPKRLTVPTKPQFSASEQTYCALVVYDHSDCKATGKGKQPKSAITTFVDIPNARVCKFQESGYIALWLFSFDCSFRQCVWTIHSSREMYSPIRRHIKNN